MEKGVYFIDKPHIIAKWNKPKLGWPFLKRQKEILIL